MMKPNSYLGRERGYPGIPVSVLGITKNISIVFFAVILLFTWNYANAQSAANCTIGTSSVNFGNIPVPFTGYPTGRGTITLSCNQTVNYAIALNGGMYFSSQTRNMLKGSDYLPYVLYQDSSYSTLWGDGNADLGPVKTGTAQPGINYGHVIYGKIPLNRGSVPPGQYSDVVTATISW